MGSREMPYPLAGTNGYSVLSVATRLGRKDARQICMPLNGRVQCINRIHQIVAALNAGGVPSGSCCGHGKMNGNIILGDGRVLLIQPKPQSDVEGIRYALARVTAKRAVTRSPAYSASALP